MIYELLLINKNKFLHNIELYNCKYVIYIILPFEKFIHLYTIKKIIIFIFYIIKKYNYF